MYEKGDFNSKKKTYVAHKVYLIITNKTKINVY